MGEILLLLSTIGGMVDAKVQCITNEMCVSVLGSEASICDSTGHCTNPYSVGGCLYQKGLVPRLRVCSSADPPNVEELGYCRQPAPNYPDVRIAAGNWSKAHLSSKFLMASIHTWLTDVMLLVANNALLIPEHAS